MVFFSCKEPNKNYKETESYYSIDSSETQYFEIKNAENSILKTWIDYYTTLDPSFSISNFILFHVDTLILQKGNIIGSFDSRFDNRFFPLLVFNENKSKYIDFDSYQILLDSNNFADFALDQEVNLVDLRENTIIRLYFCSESHFVENAFWENEDVIILLEGSIPNVPRIKKIDLLKQTIESFEYLDTLETESKYSIKRLNQNGIFEKI